MQELFLHQLVTEFTRFPLSQQPPVLNYGLNDDDSLIDEIRYDSPLGKSDHMFLPWFITLHVKDSKKTELLKITMQ